MKHLIDALLGTGKDVCVAQARKIAVQPAGQDVKLHLRQADLTVQDMRAIASALERVAVFPTEMSVSYNPDITAAGAIALIDVLPQALGALGMVGCDLDDTVGHALCDWASKSTGIRLVCVEDNRFSPEVRGRLAALHHTIVSI